MNITAFIRYQFLMRKFRSSRYSSIFKIIRRNACRKIIEIGVYNGNHSLQMIQTASISHPKKDIYFYGFDLFEDLNEEMFKKESSKKPLPIDLIRHKLEETGAHIGLFKGNTKITLPRYIKDIGEADFIFIDGGHSEETIKSDWNNVREIIGDKTIVMFDDYYIDKKSEMTGFGCNALVDNLDRQIYDVDILEPMDIFNKDWGTLKIKMVKVCKKKIGI
jgi:hypothetical protein